MLAILIGILCVISSPATAGNNFRAECVAAKIAVVNRDISFLERRPELFVGVDACDLDLAEAVFGCDAFAEALLKLDASLINGTVVTPLDHAIFNNNATAAAWLVDRGAGLNHIDLFGNSPLEYAAFNNAVAVIKVLLERGADVNLRTIRKRTALMTAILYGRTASFWFLLPLSDLSLTDDRGYTALLYAAESNFHEAVGALLVAGADVHVRSSSGHTVLMAAVKAHALPPILTALVNAGADVLARGPGEETAAIIAAQRCSLATLHTLATLGATVPDDVGRFCMLTP